MWPRTGQPRSLYRPLWKYHMDTGLWDDAHTDISVPVLSTFSMFLVARLPSILSFRSLTQSEWIGLPLLSG
ncbi:hypothetical protein PM082_010741 [Marasmius tenuissimus]|nr:hypothetical protein PM082_010741 [Marasmius tenuissimus]